MNAQEKTEVIESLRERLGRATIAIVAEPRGLSVAQVTSLRRKMRGVAGEYKIAKNTLALRALDGSSYSSLSSMMEGQTALVFGYGDPVVVAKELLGYSKDNEEKLSIKGAMFEGQLFGRDEVAQLANLATKEQLRASLLGVLIAPAGQLVRLLNEPGSALARVLKARLDSGAAPAGSAPAEPPAAASEPEAAAPAEAAPAEAKAESAEAEPAAAEAAPGEKDGE